MEEGAAAVVAEERQCCKMAQVESMESLEEELVVEEGGEVMVVAPMVAEECSCQSLSSQ